MPHSSTSNSERAQPRQGWGKAGRIALVALFMAALWIVLPVTWLRRDLPDAGLENRRLAPLPHLFPSLASWRAFPSAFQGYFNDHFGLRAELLRLYSRLLVEGMGTSSDPQVLLGENGWIFL